MWWTTSVYIVSDHPGWLAKGHQRCPTCILTYWTQHDTFTVEYSIFLCGKALPTPLSERKQVLASIHKDHKGTNKIPAPYLQVCTGPTWMQISRALLNLVRQANTSCHSKHAYLSHALLFLCTLGKLYHLTSSHFDGHEWLLVTDFCSRMSLVCHILYGQ